MKKIKALGIAATILGMGATLFSDWVDEKAMEEMIDEKINLAIAQKEDDEEEES